MLLRVDEAVIDRKGVLRVSGWLLSVAPIEAVEVMAGVLTLGKAEFGLERPDVAKAWPDFTNAGNSGFLLMADVAALVTGDRSAPIPVKVAARASGGMTREVTLAADAPRIIARRRSEQVDEIFCDYVTLTNHGRLLLGGWALSSAGVEKLNILFEDEPVGVADYGQERPDVGNKFPGVAGSRTCGFSFRGSVDRARVKDRNVLRLEMVRADGEARTHDVSVTATAVAPRAQAPAAPEIPIHIDTPQIVDGKAVRPVEGTLSIAGWAVAKDRIASIKIDLDGRVIGSAYYGVRREDVAKAHPDYGWDNALLSGFAFSVPHRSLTEGEHRVTLNLATTSGQEKAVGFDIRVAAQVEQPGPWTLRERIPAAELLFARRLMQQLSFRPAFYVWISCSGDNATLLADTLRSLGTQSYDSWHVVVSGDAPLAAEIKATIAREFPDLASRASCFMSERQARQLASKARARDLVLPLECRRCARRRRLVRARARGRPQSGDRLHLRG